MLSGFFSESFLNYNDGEVVTIAVNLYFLFVFAIQFVIVVFVAEHMDSKYDAMVNQAYNLVDPRNHDYHDETLKSEINFLLLELNRKSNCYWTVANSYRFGKVLLLSFGSGLISFAVMTITTRKQFNV